MGEARSISTSANLKLMASRRINLNLPWINSCISFIFETLLKISLSHMIVINMEKYTGRTDVLFYKLLINIMY